jgi:diguanylate cyclase (GGDEF)-like protein/putative nucleotidyltransferase with HDIG domain
MGSPDSQGPNEKIGTSFWVSLSVAVLALTAALLGGWSGSTIQLALFVTTLFIASVLGDHAGRVPYTDIPFAPRHIAIFWAILNLGALGGLAVAAAACLSSFSSHRDRRSEWTKTAFAELFAAAVAGSAYAAGLVFTSGFESVSGMFLVPVETLWASAAMVAAHFLATAAVGRLISQNENGDSSWVRTAKLHVRSFVGRLITAFSAILMLAAFRHFGYAFALVVVPAVLLGNLAYRIHVLRLTQKTKELVDANRLHLATVEALATAIDARDQVGIGHVRRTQIYAVGIGMSIGLNEDELNALRAGALLHDIGKLAVPEHILNKPGRLTSAELEKTKVHSGVGASILEKVGFPYPVLPTVRHHHEHWDGGGYPDGLCGDRIPITARILSVADAYDALRGERPYRAAVSRDDACNFLRTRAGTQFDPNIVTTFLRNLKKLESEVEIHGLAYENSAAEPKQTTDVSVGNYVEQIKRANQEVFSLYEMARDFGAALNLEETLRLLTRKVSQFVPYDTCLIYLLDDGSETATAAHVDGRNSEALKGKEVKIGEGATGYVLKKRKPVENVDPSLDFAFSHSEICRHYVGMASVPLLAEERLIGAITVFSGKLAVYEEEHLRLLETIARIAGDAISKSIKHAENEVQALTDQLTGLPNSRSLQMQFGKEVGRARRTGESLQLLMLDLDGFKSVNDNLGHQAGDKMLSEIGRIIKSELRDYDHLARYGGDEFVALVPGTDSADVIELCSRIESAIAAHADLALASGVSVGVSIGAASYPTQGETFEELLIAADKAMYRTKTFHRQRNVRMGDSTNTIAGTDPLGDEPSRMSDEFDPGLVVELDAAPIVRLDTVN